MRTPSSSGAGSTPTISSGAGPPPTRRLGEASSAPGPTTGRTWTPPPTGTPPGGTGLLALQAAFLRESRGRLHAPLELLFPEAVSVDENGIAVPVLPTLPSRYDLARLDAGMREELSLADPRQGGGDFSMAVMISEVVVDMLHEFCVMARRAISDAGEEGRALDSRSGSVSESTAHNLNVAGVMVRCFCSVIRRDSPCF